MNYIGLTEKNLITLKTVFWYLKLSFYKNTAGYNDVWLIGPATFVFKGELTW
jgi:diaminopimelate epimerase